MNGYLDLARLAACEFGQLEDNADAVRKAEFSYGGARTNSNSFSRGAVRTLGLMRLPVPSVLALGANSPLMLSERR